MNFPPSITPSLAAAGVIALVGLQSVEAAGPSVETDAADSAVSFNHDIRPILSENCIFCHGPDPEERSADLRLDLYVEATADRGGYAALVPGDREASEVWARINDSDDPMPPVKSHKSLTAEEIEAIGQWIDQGATYEVHWSYDSPVRQEVPETSEPDWSANPIDQFILAKLDKHQIEPSPRANRRTLMRRTAFDLTGLPPSPAKARAFLDDTSAGAHARLVDSLLDDPAFGEHMAVWWLDQVRYADTIGVHSDNPRSVWPYRDWVIRAFNENMPFDRFTIMQLAGDLLQPEPTRDMLVASAYNRLALQTEEGGAQPKEYKAIINTDRVSNYSDVWLGSSVACAECHDHKFDPFTAKDFYSLAAFFADLDGALVSTRRGYAGHKAPFAFLPETPEQESKVAEVEQPYQDIIDRHPEAIRVEEHFSSGNPRPPMPGGEMPEYGERFKKLLDQRAKLAESVPYVVVSRARDVPRTVRVLARGNWQDESGEIVRPATPDFLEGPASSEDNRLTRLDLAKWTVSPRNPLTSRVIVNRLWARLFGHPLSANTVDLGNQGSMPTHPALLDWLAVEFQESGWDLKHLVRLMITSETYRQSSDVRPELADIDPDNNKLFARQSSIRLPAEALRDQVLSVAGLLDERLGGPSVFPYQPEGHWTPLNFPRRKYPTSSGDDLYRRGLYSWIQRTFPHPMMATFDVPARESCTGQRMVSTTPLQALATLNSPEHVEAARVLAATLVRAHETNAKRLDQLFFRVLSREPREAERAKITTVLESQQRHFQENRDNAEKLIRVGESPAADDLDPAEVAAWTSVCRIVLNLHETLTRH